MRGAEFTVDAGQGHSFRYVADPDDIFAPLLYWGGLHGYEAETIDLFRDLAAGANVVIDAGANTGVFTLVACAAGNAQVHAIEPEPVVAAGFRRHIAMNGLDGRVTLHEVAASDQAGTVEFSRNEHRGIGHIRTDIETGEWSHVEVPAARIDELVNGPVDLVKIDVEGWEAALLRGMTGILEQRRPTIVVEVLPWAEGSCAEVLAPYDYRIEQITPKGLREVVDPLDVSTINGENNFLCTPR